MTEVNPVRRRIHRLIEANLRNAFESIDLFVLDGYVTEHEVTEILVSGWDQAVADSWQEYASEE